MKLGDRVSLCHLASLKQDLVPPDPRFHLVAVSPHELAISLGSLAFTRPYRCNLSKQTPSGDYSSESVLDVDTNNGYYSNASRLDPRRTSILLKCTLYSHGKPVSDTVAVHLNRNNIFGLREVLSGSTDTNCRRVKHCDTYNGGSCLRFFSGTNFVRCKLLRLKNKDYMFRLKRRLRCQPVEVPVVDESTAPSWYSNLGDMLTQSITPPKSDVFRCSDTEVERRIRKSCRKCCHRFPLQSDRINLPAIIQIDSILRFQLWHKLRGPNPDLQMHNEMYVDDTFVARSELDIAPIKDKVNCFVDMFYDGLPNTKGDKHVCDIRSCCCDSEKQLVCTSHFERIYKEVQRLIALIFSQVHVSAAAAFGKYRYLLYFYLQVLSFSNCDALQSCGITLPIAFLTVGVVEFINDDVKLESTDGSCRMHFWRPTYAGHHLSSMEANSKHEFGTCNASLPKGKLKMGMGPHFERAEIYYRKCRSRRRVLSLYLGPTFKESMLTNACRNRGQTTNIPTYGMPSILSFLLDCDLYKDDYIVCPSMLDSVILHSSMYTISGGITFLPEPSDLSFLKLLIRTPLYGVGISLNPCDTVGVSTSFGSIGYRQINELMWRYQPLLSKSGEALTTFLRFVDWKSADEASAALLAMHKWREPTFITLLELISPDFSPPNVVEAVQKYACNLLITKYSVKALASFFPQLLVAPGAHHLLDRLIQLSCKDYGTALYLYWALECWDRVNSSSSHSVGKFIATLERDAAGGSILKAIKAQRLLRQRLNFLMRHIKSRNYGYAAEHNLNLVEFLRGESRLEVFHGLGPRVASTSWERVTFDLEVPLFTDPSLNISAVDTSSCSIIKTTRYPLLLTFHLRDGLSSVHERLKVLAGSDAVPSIDNGSPMKEANMLVKHIMFKDGDDLRLDQVCQQIAKLADEILRSHGVESYIKCYGVLSTSSRDGFVEFLKDTKSISTILRESGSIESFLIEKGTSFVDDLVKRLNFVGSLASYSVLTHLLGVGDRHNDNLILSKSGHVVHVDYGYILGSDPRLLPLPPFKLSNELLGFLGGRGSFFYRMFKERFYLVFSILRRHAKLIIILIYLLAPYNLRNVNFASIVDMESKFMLCVEDPTVLKRHVNYLIDSSATSLTSQVSDKWHQFSMFWK
ncbi:phosphatidylinositol 3-and 4-kinase domain containing protein [Babesia divergens]|uniref:Phosphatidylinositol 3-and 4-kinase domain containing protein n=1 Tax=Babesia divergens TaxID=32595 RepID=A0AAD9GJF4_BABDI|nr:phosphatidylinositol 3-and 4-kinase domain containing protein [Babesia divergens]